MPPDQHILANKAWYSFNLASKGRFTFIHVYANIPTISISPAMHDLIDLDPILYKINNNNVKLATLCRYFFIVCKLQQLSFDLFYRRNRLSLIIGHGFTLKERFIVKINSGPAYWHMCHVTQTVQTRNLMKVFFCNSTKMYYISAVRYVFARE